MSSALIIRGDAAHLPFGDGSVNLIITSPPYFSLRSYRDAGGHYAGQIGAEPTPQEFLEALWAVMKECWRVLADDGVCWVNLGDKRAGSGSHNQFGAQGTTGQMAGRGITRGRDMQRNAPLRYNQAAFGRRRSRMLLPHRFAIGCEDGRADPDGIGWCLIWELVWSKPNGLPESVPDRGRDSHEYWFMFTKQPTAFFSAVDEIREPHSPMSLQRAQPHRANVRTHEDKDTMDMTQACNPAGRLPDSVWTIATEALQIPDYFIEDDRGWRFVWAGKAPAGKDHNGSGLFAVDKARGMKPGLVALWRYAEQRHREGLTHMRLHSFDHFAAFPQEWPRRLILGWSASGICTECGRGRWPVTETVGEGRRLGGRTRNAQSSDDGLSDAAIRGYACGCTPFTDHPGTGEPSPTASVNGKQGERPVTISRVHKRVGPRREYHLNGWNAPATRPSVVLDPFGGTGTTAMVALALGRFGISVDLSMDYCRLARWRIEESGGAAKSVRKTWDERQGQLLG